MRLTNLLTGAVIMGGTWGTVVALHEGDTSTGSMILAGAAGLIPATFLAVKVSDWTSKYRIIPMDVQGEDGRLDLNRLKLELQQDYGY